MDKNSVLFDNELRHKDVLLAHAQVKSESILFWAKHALESNPANAELNQIKKLAQEIVELFTAEMGHL